MGYVREKTYRLTFEDPDYAGLEITAHGASVAAFMELSELKDSGSREAVTLMFEAFAAALVAWNLESADGVTLPLTAESLWAQDFEFSLNLVTTWMEAVASVAVPLSQRSNGGGISPVLSLPMEPLSPSRAS